MEKILRLLNPKTTNFESIGGGSYGALTSQDVCTALSYAKFTKIQELLLQIYALNRATVEELKKVTKVIHAEFVRLNESELTADHQLSLFVALVELCAVASDYKPSVRNRAVIAGVTNWQIQTKLGVTINQYKSKLVTEIEIIESKIEYQLNKNT